MNPMIQSADGADFAMKFDLPDLENGREHSILWTIFSEKLIELSILDKAHLLSFLDTALFNCSWGGKTLFRYYKVPPEWDHDPEEYFTEGWEVEFCDIDDRTEMFEVYILSREVESDNEPSLLALVWRIPEDISPEA